MASYIQSILGPDEHVTFEGRTTNWIYFWPWVLVLVTAALGVVAWSYGLAWWLAAWWPVVVATLLLHPFVRQKTTELVVTDRRVVAKTGLIGRKTIEMRLSKIESIRVDQNLWERMGGYGTVVLHGTGGAAEPIAQVRDPLAFKRAVEVQLEAFEDTGRA